MNLAFVGKIKYSFIILLSFSVPNNQRLRGTYSWLLLDIPEGNLLKHIGTPNICFGMY